MLTRRVALALLLCAPLASAACRPTTPTPETSTMSPPVAPQRPHRLQAHGHERNDEYYWMRSDDRSDPEVLEYLRDENAYTEHVLAPVADFRERLYQEIIGRIAQDDSTVPYREAGDYHYARYEEGREYPIYCRRRGSEAADEEILLDVNTLAEGHSFYQVGAMALSESRDILAYAEDTVGRRIYDVRFKRVGTGAPSTGTLESIDEVLEGTSGGMVFAADDLHLFYVKREEGTLRAHQVWRHRLGTPQSEDVLVFDETNDQFWVTVSRTTSREYIVIGSYQTLSHELRTIPANEPLAEPRVFLPREARHEYDIDHLAGRFYIRTNWQARDFRLMSTTLEESADKARWREEVPQGEGVFLRDFALFDDYLVVAERRDAIARLRVVPWADRDAGHEVAFDEEVYVSRLGTNRDPSTTTLRLNYSSMTTPSTVYDYDMVGRGLTVRKVQPVLGGFDASEYVTGRTFATAEDGTRVPISYVHRRDLDRSQPQPLWLYAYGSYGYSMDPDFGSTRLSLLDRGFIYAIAHVRGGQEYGRAWYEAGKLLHKRNTFTDFIACAEHLQNEGWTSPELTFAQGGSAGGLLMGAVANMAPERFFGIVAEVPFVDVVTTMLDETIPLTTFEYDEWGNPNQREFYEYMLSYSPYDNVTAQAYPNMMIMSGLHDSQVQYWEPTKWIARLRQRDTGGRRLLLHTNMEAGHGGASGRFRRQRERALVFAAMLDLIGIRE